MLFTSDSSPEDLFNGLNEIYAQNQRAQMRMLVVGVGVGVALTKFVQRQKSKKNTPTFR